MRGVIGAIFVAVLVSGCTWPSGTSDHVRDIDAFLDDLEANWRYWDERCTPEAPFALAYWMLNAAVRDEVEAGAFDDDEAVAQWAIAFGRLYLEAADARRAGVNASAPWQAAFDWGDTGRSVILEDMLLAMNAHMGHDLVVATHEAGFVEAGRRADFFRIDGVFENETHAIVQRVAAEYSPLLRPPVSNNVTEAVALRVILEWREAAWEDAMAWSAAPDREGFRQDLLDRTLARADALHVPKGDTSEERVAYCQAQNAS